jgi:hypothetical protein
MGADPAFEVVEECKRSSCQQRINKKHERYGNFSGTTHESTM